MRISSIQQKGEALIEAQRCLDCFEPACVQACPARVPVPTFIKRLQEDNLDGAGDAIYAACPLGLVCGVACPTSDLCEGACTLNKSGQTPVRIGALQAFITSHYDLAENPAGHGAGKAVAVIGAGPSGLGCAMQLKRMGFEVEVFEKSNSIGGLTERVIPYHRLPSSVISHDVNRLKGAGVKFHLGVEVDGENAKALIEDFDAIFIGTGLSADKEYRVEGMEGPVDGIVPALEYLDWARKYEEGTADLPQLGKRVIVIGGGNVALDAAVVAKRLGSQQVIVLYRRDKNEMPGWESEYLEATSLGVEFRWLSSVDSATIEMQKLHSVNVQPMKFTETEEGGRRWVEPDLELATYALPCVSLIYALGQKLDVSIADHFAVGTLDGREIQVDPSTYHTNIPKVFAAGEAVSGGATIVYSMSQGMAAGRSIGKWLSEGK
jgi:dihydropyrimidine dehydrogenase (NAD+) subunit PreT